MRSDKDYKREDKRNKVRDVYGDNFNLLAIKPSEKMIVSGRTRADDMAHKSMITGNPLFKKEDIGFNTFIAVHGNPRNFSLFGQGEVSMDDKKTMERIIELNKCDTPSDDLLILSMCYVDDDKAKYIAEKTNKRVVYGNGGVILSKLKKSGDIRIKEETGKNLKMAYPDGRSSHQISKKFLVPVSKEMSLIMLDETLLERNKRVVEARTKFPTAQAKRQAAKRDSTEQAVITSGAMSTVQATRNQEQQNPIEKKNSEPSKTSKVTKSFKM